MNPLKKLAIVVLIALFSIPMLKLNAEGDVNNEITWNASGGDWWEYNKWVLSSDMTKSIEFLDGDKVVFPGNKKVNIFVGYKVKVSDMVIEENGSYSFDGSPITISTDGSTLADSTGNLVLKNDVFVVLSEISLTAEKIVIGEGANLKITEDASINNTPIYLEEKAWIDFIVGPIKETIPITKTYNGKISGTGILEKNGAGELVLSGTLSEFSGFISVVHGSIRLDAKFGGSYVQNADGLLIVEPGASIAKEASILGAISGSPFSIGEYAEFYDTSFEFDPSNLTSNAFITVGGDVSIEGNGNSIVLKSFTSGSIITLIESSTKVSASRGNFTSDPISITNVKLEGRERTRLVFEPNAIKIIMETIGSTNLTWAGGTGVWDKFSENFTGDFKTFIDHDFVTFDETSDGTVTVADNVLVSGMKIESGNYVFTGADITGSTDIVGVVSDALIATGKLLVDGTSVAEFQNKASFSKGVSIGPLAKAVLSGENGSFDNNEIENSGTLEINKDTPFTFEGTLTGSGTLVKKGSGVLTLNDAVSEATGPLEHIEGGIILTKVWGGSYVGECGTTFVGESYATITGAASFKGTVSGRNITVGGDASFEDVTINLSSSSLEKELFMKVRGALSFSGAKTQVVIDEFKPGTYTIISHATKSFDFSSNFSSKNVTITGAHAGRQGGELIFSKNAVKIEMSDGFSVYLTWAAGSDTWDTSAGKFTGDSDYFVNHDHVIFSENNQGTVTVESPVEVSGMDITSGNYVFSGSVIRGTKTVTGAKVNPTARLSILNSAVSEFQNQVSFDSGIYIAKDAKAILTESGSFA
ncbi:MAG: hypothetical protein LBF22_04650, partial [Deltaproteobacteria bacterium]|nr:hypothetical protein [Deltaproteobacteria bacterium]